MNNKTTRIAYLVTHPIQYQVPLFKRITKEKNIELTVFFCSDFSVHQYIDKGFGQAIHWDVNLTDGYKHVFLPALGRRDVLTFFRPFNYGLKKELVKGKFDVLWVHGYMRLFYWHAIWIAKRKNIRVYVRDEANLFSKQRGYANQILKRIFFRILDRVVDAYLAIGTANSEYYISNGISPKKITLVPYAVDNEYFQRKSYEVSLTREKLRSELGLENDRKVILFAGKLQKRKRPLDLLEAYKIIIPKFQKVPYLIYVGTGEMQDTLKDQVALLNNDSIYIMGFKNQSELPNYYDLCDVFVMPSNHEPWGLVINEVLNFSKPVIVSDQAGCYPDLVRQGENGYVYRANDIVELAEKLVEVLTDEQKLRAMGKKSLEVINQWSYEQDLAGLYKSISSTEHSNRN